jgi:hypothetical protein
VRHDAVAIGLSVFAFGFGAVVEATGHAAVGGGEFKEGECRSEKTLAGERKWDARDISGDPATAPLLGDVGRGSRAAGWVEYEVAGVRGHEHAAFDNLRGGLYHVGLFSNKASFA